MTTVVRTVAFVAYAMLACVARAQAPAVAAAPACHVGLYRLENSTALDIAPSSDDKLRWRMLDGTSGAMTRSPDNTWQSTLGWTDRPDRHGVKFGECAAGEIEFDAVRGRREPLETLDVDFMSGDTRLAGRLVMPTGEGKVPIVVLVHGSEQSSAREYFALQRLFPAEGIGAFVYDKRGTGGSAGTYTHDYPVLAADAVAAVGEARRLAGARAGRVGFQASSQGGWVAPLAATSTQVDFIIVAYGLAVSPLDEDREAVTLDMTRHGFGRQEIRKALEVAAAAHTIIFSGFTTGYDELDALRARYEKEPWFAYLRGNVTNLLLNSPHDEMRKRGPVWFAGILPNYDAMPVLRRLKTSQLWILAGDDIDAPIGETLKRLRMLKRQGRPISAVVYPGTEHGMFEFETNAAGERLSLRQPASYLPLMCEFIRNGRVGGRVKGATVDP